MDLLILDWRLTKQTKDIYESFEGKYVGWSIKPGRHFMFSLYFIFSVQTVSGSPQIILFYDALMGENSVNMKQDVSLEWNDDVGR